MADTKYKLVGTNVGRAVGDNFLLDNCDFLRRLLIYILFKKTSARDTPKSIKAFAK